MTANFQRECRARIARPERDDQEQQDDEEEVEASSRQDSVDPPCARRDDGKRPVGQSEGYS